MFGGDYYSYNNYYPTYGRDSTYLIQSAANAQAEAEREAMQRRTIITTANSTITAKCIIPPGIIPGQRFRVVVNGQQFEVTCPMQARPGMEILIQVPSEIPVAAPTTSQPNYSIAAAAAAANQGRELLRAASSGPTLNTILTVTKDQPVNESDPTYAMHDIISVYEGENVTLLEGSLSTGLGGNYGDYVKIKRIDSVQGKVSRFVLAPMSSSAPPPPALR